MIDVNSITDDLAKRELELFSAEEPIRRWEKTRVQFLEVVNPEQRADVSKLLDQLQQGASGLRDWVTSIAWHGAASPRFVPAEVINVYLQDDQAAALHRCEDCGLAVPIRPNALHGVEGEPERRYFVNCPLCGGRTGQPLASIDKSIAKSSVVTQPRLPKPR